MKNVGRRRRMLLEDAEECLLLGDDEECCHCKLVADFGFGWTRFGWDVGELPSDIGVLGRLDLVGESLVECVKKQCSVHACNVLVVVIVNE